MDPASPTEGSISKLEQYKNIILEQLPECRGMQSSDLTFFKLKGMTNETYLVELPYSANNVHKFIFRKFGSVKGLVDQDLELAIFLKLGEIGIGPKTISYEKGKWRIEAYIEGGIHPTIDDMKRQDFRNLFAINLARFNNVEIETGEKQPRLQAACFNAEVIASFNKKAQNQEIFTPEEYVTVQQLAELVSATELDFVKTLIPTASAVKFCHNDLNALNMFITQKKGQRVVLIDYEYCGLNYVAYEIGNFMNECCFDYTYAQAPYYRFIEDNAYKDEDINKFVAYYCLQEALLSSPQEALLSEQLETNAENDSEINFERYIEKEELPNFKKKVDQLIHDVKRCRVLSQWYWALWSIITCKPDVQMNFEHLVYGAQKLKLYRELKQDLLK